MESVDKDLIVRYLNELGYSTQDVQAVLDKLRAYDSDVVKQSIFDSIATGSFNLESLIAEMEVAEDAKQKENDGEGKP